MCACIFHFTTEETGAKEMKHFVYDSALKPSNPYFPITPRYPDILLGAPPIASLYDLVFHAPLMPEMVLSPLNSLSFMSLILARNRTQDKGKRSHRVTFIQSVKCILIDCMW